MADLLENPNLLDELGWARGPDEDWEDGDYEEDEEGVLGADFALTDLFEHCVLPTLRDASVQFAVVLLWCVIFRGIVSLFKLPRIPAHLLSAITGVVALSTLFGESLLYFPAFATIGYAGLGLGYLLKQWHGCGNLCGPLSGIILVASIITYEFFVADPVVWHMVRGAQMLVVMKVVSLGFDMDSGALPNIPNGSEFYGYVLHVGSVVFGPWVPFKDYVAAIDCPPINLAWVISIAHSTLCAMLCFSVSSCFSIYLGALGQWKWWLAYVDALSYRMSHYFVSYMSEATVVASGVRIQPPVQESNKKDDDKQVVVEESIWSSWRYPVSDPTQVELPRSLVQVVVYWNIPMHRWLKNYVFKPSRHLGLSGFPAILLTYCASAMLHGLNAQLWLVLLSLGLCTYSEHILREKLSRIYDSCIRARPCLPKKCEHKKTWKDLTAFGWNCVFAFFAVWSLAYLGVMFDSDPKLQEQGYDFSHTFAKWLHLNFTGHWIAFGMLTMYYLLK